jgi:tRNA dimethylallyltransferase
MKKLIAIVGPTATGKSALALWLSTRYKVEIINADSRQIYHYMDIGTAKPGILERQLVPHHLYDIVDPDESFSLALYQGKALKLINEINSRDNIPVLIGGTGLYIRATLEKWSIPDVPPNAEFRRILENRAAQEGHNVLYAELQKVAPESAKRISPTNIRRVIRALEISHYSSHYSLTSNRNNDLEGVNPLIIGLTMDRKRLYSRIDVRVDHMIGSGLIGEVKSLMNRGYRLDLPSMSGIGYRELGLFLNGEISLSEAVSQIKYHTHRFARKQYAWFKLSDIRMQWFDVETDIKDNIARLVDNYLQS